MRVIFPAVSKLRKYPSSSDDYFTFEIGAVFPDRQPKCLLYVAESFRETHPHSSLLDGNSIELHEFCANLGHAPPIFAFQELPGGWDGVLWRWNLLSLASPITHSDLLPAHRNRWIAELQQLMDNFHKKGLVHGDLRDANIICKGDSMILIDFDWGGKKWRRILSYAKPP